MAWASARQELDRRHCGNRLDEGVGVTRFGGSGASLVATPELRQVAAPMLQRNRPVDGSHQLARIRHPVLEATRVLGREIDSDLEVDAAISVGHPSAGIDALLESGRT